VFSGVLEVSVYAVYYMVIRGIKTIITSLIGPGLSAAFGNMLAKNEIKNVEKNLKLYEFLTNFLVVLFFTCTAVLVVPFVSVYTKGIEDVEYNRPLFAYIACIAQGFFVLRIPYQELVMAAGHFKQTRNGAIMEVAINIIISIVLVFQFGLVGVAIGSLCAMLFRTVQYAIYMSRNIIQRKLWTFIRKILLSILNAIIIIIIVQILPEMVDITYVAWLLLALMVLGVSASVTVLFAVVFYREELRIFVSTVRSVIQRDVAVHNN